MKDVSGETLRVHAHQHAFITRLCNVAIYQCDVLMCIDVIFVADHAPNTEFGREPRFCNTMHEALGLETMRNELGNRDESQLVFSREFLELRPPCSSSILVQDLAYDAGGKETRKPSEIDRRFSMTNSLQHST